jgi:hypothetical protein
VRGDAMMFGVGRPTLDVNAANVDETADFWGVHSGANGKLYHNGEDHDWQGGRTTARATCSVCCWTRTPAR